MSVLVDERTRLAVAGITGREGTFHTLNNRALRHQRRRRRHARQGRPGRRGHPRVRQLGGGDGRGPAEHRDDLRAARFAADAILEAAAAGVELVITITEGIPAHDELRVYNTLKRDHPGTRLIGPNCPGILSPGKANVGIIPASFFKAGQRRRGIALGDADLPDRQRDRPGRLRLQLDRRDRRRPRARAPPSSTCSSSSRPTRETELVVLSGEIGGSAEEEAAEYIAAHMSKPVVAYIAGFTAPAGKQMGHAGAIVSGPPGTAAAKAEALEAKGVRVGRTPTEAAEIAVEVLGGASRRRALSSRAPEPRRAARLALDGPGGGQPRSPSSSASCSSARAHPGDDRRTPATAARAATPDGAGERRPCRRDRRERTHARRRRPQPASAPTDRPRVDRAGSASPAAPRRWRRHPRAAAGRRRARRPPAAPPRHARRPRPPTPARRPHPRRPPGRRAPPSCCAFASGWSERRASSPTTTTSCSDA